MAVFLLTLLVIPTLQADTAIPPCLAGETRRTVELLYNMEFAAAEDAARRMVTMAPEHPAGYFYEAATYWQRRWITRDASQRATLLARFHESTERALQVATRLPALHESEAAFYLGATYGMRARMYVAEKRYLKALSAAKKGGAYLRRCVELDPARHDAYLGLGLYHYALARAPALFQGILQWLVGLQGDRDKGLQQLEWVRAHGVLAAPEAASLLARLYAGTHERQYDKAHALLRELVERYPNNVEYRLRLAVVSIQLGLWQQARQISRGVIADIERGRPYYSRALLPELSYRVAETYVLQGNHAAAHSLLAGLQTQELDEGLRAWVTLRLGNVHDLQAEHHQAQQFYQRVAGDDAADQLAAQYLSKPFNGQHREVMPLGRTL